MSAVWASITLWTVWPLMSMPRICAGLLHGVVRVGGQLHAAGLAAAAGLDLRLDDRAAAESLGHLARRLRRVDDFTGQHRYAVLGEEVPRLVLEQVHARPSP